MDSDNLKESASTPEVKPRLKRLVLEHTQGPLAGLYRIIGLAEWQVPHLEGPFQIANDTHVVQFASLIRVFPKWLHMREVFDRTQVSGRLDDYMPEGPDAHFDPIQV